MRGDCTTEYRISRVKARLKFMIDDYGVERFAIWSKRRLALSSKSATIAAARDRKRSHGYPRAEACRPLNYVGFPVRLGLMSGSQMREDRRGCSGGWRRYPADAASEFHRCEYPQRAA